MNLASQIRAAGIGVEVYPDAKKLGQQLKYADSRGSLIALIAGANEFAARTVQLKNLRTGESEEVSLAEGSEALVSRIRAVVAVA